MKSLDKVFRIIDLLKSNKSMKLQEITNELGLPKSTVHRIISKLMKNKYIYKDSNNIYKLGYKFLEISNSILNDFDLRDVAKDSIDKLSEITKNTVHLAMLISKEVIYIDKRESQHSIRMYSQIGKTAPTYCTGVGKVLLAFQSKKAITEILDNTSFHRYTNNTIVSKDSLLKELSEIRKNGYAVDNEEHEKNIGCIAAPICNSENTAVGAISITAILYDIKFEEILNYKDLLIAECKNISKKLGYQK